MPEASGGGGEIHFEAAGSASSLALADGPFGAGLGRRRRAAELEFTLRCSAITHDQRRHRHQRSDPARVLGGRNERGAGRAGFSCPRGARGAPHSTPLLFDSGGHFLSTTRVEEFDRLVLDFIRRYSA
jgi:hypothetical protein